MASGQLLAHEADLHRRCPDLAPELQRAVRSEEVVATAEELNVFAKLVFASRVGSRPTPQIGRAICSDTLHGHSALSRANSRHSGGKGQYGRAMLIPDTIQPVYTGDRAIRFLPGRLVQTCGERRPRWSEGGQFSVIRRPRRLRGTSRRPPIGRPPRGPGVQHNRVLPHSAFRGQTPDEMYFGARRS
jgi:hypothetical protein